MYEGLLAGFVRLRIVVIVVYLLVSGAVIGLIGPQLGREIFPAVSADQFRLRMRAPTARMSSRPNGWPRKRCRRSKTKSAARTFT
jgi:multidrug efflux pump subunit AcrB